MAEQAISEEGEDELSPSEKEAAIRAEIEQIEADIMQHNDDITTLSQMLDNSREMRAAAIRVRMANLAALVTLEEGKFK